MSESTPRLNLPLVGDHSQKRIVMNAGLMRLESLVQAAVLSRTLAVQPPTPADGDAYILPAGASGSAWAGFAAGDVVRYDSLVWEAIAFPGGALVYVAAENRFVVRSGGGWVVLETALKALDNLSHVGINTTADATNVLALKGPGALLSAQSAGAGGSGDISVAINKDTASDTAQLLLQTDYSSRAILGLLGNDDLTLKVSPDGGTFTTALSVNRTTGSTTFVSGSASAPAVAAGSADTGLYRVDSGTLGVSIGGVLCHSLSAAGIAATATGSVLCSVAVDGEAGASVRVTRYSNDATGPTIGTRKARGTLASPAVVVANDACGLNQAVAYSGSAFVAVGNTGFVVTETMPSSTAMGSRFRINMNATGSAVLTEFMRMDHATGVSMFGANVVIDQNRNVRARVYTAATLPAASAAAGQRAQVSDASSPVFAAVVSGGGSTHCPVYSDGSSWRCG